MPFAQRFLGAFGCLANRFRLQRHLLTAGPHRIVRHARYATGREAVAVATAARPGRDASEH